MRIVCEGEVIIRDNAQIVLDDGASLAMYTSASVTIGGNAKVNVNSADPSRLTWQLVSDNIELSGGAQLYSQVQGYAGSLVVRGLSHFYGTFKGRAVVVADNGSLHVDSLPGSAAVEGPDNSSRGGLGRIVWWTGKERRWW